MKNLLCKGISVLLLLLVLVQLLPAAPVQAAPETDETYYGEAYPDLSEEHRIAYRLIEEGIAGLSPRIELEGIVQINYKQLVKILRAVCVDHPQYFWFLETGSFSHEDVSDGGYVRSFDPTYILNGKTVAVGSQELADAMYAFHTKVQQIISGIPVNLTTEYEIALYLHDYLAETVTYTLEGEHPSAYAALVLGEAACYGYSKAYQCLLNAAGIRARTLTGDSPDENGNLVGHAWNQIWLDGDCYYVDVTWDDFEEVTVHGCFAVSLEAISKDHFAGEEFTLPECTHECIDYYALSQGPGTACAGSSTTAQEIAACFRMDPFQADATFVCEVRYTGGNFLSWFDRISPELGTLLGLSRKATLYYYTMDDVYHLSIVDTAYTQSAPSISAISLSEDTVALTGTGRQYRLCPEIQSDSAWTPNLVYTSSDPAVAVVDEMGLVTSVGEGTALITASSTDGAVSASLTLTVSPAPEHIHTMRLFTTKSPICIQDGYETHYLCTGCGIRFADEAGTNALMKTSDFIFPATGHQSYSWVKQNEHHVQQCECGDVKLDTKQAHYDQDGDIRCDACGAIMPLSNAGTPGGGNQEKISGWVLPVVIGAVAVAAVAAFLLIRRRRRGY